MGTAWLLTVAGAAAGFLALAAGARALFLYYSEGSVNRRLTRTAYFLAGMYWVSLFAALVLLIHEAGR